MEVFTRIYVRMQPALKAWVAAIVPMVVTLVTMAVDAAVVEVEPTVAAVIIVVLTAAGVYRAPNTDVPNV